MCIVRVAGSAVAGDPGVAALPAVTVVGHDDNAIGTTNAAREAMVTSELFATGKRTAPANCLKSSPE